ncbi:hypothetical protein BGX38DRAFT_412764 [Terfezia claveryi]|nr:hypothetical protein BGX38DRAFT_412764 [Terfezia claveryi]
MGITYKNDLRVMQFQLYNPLTQLSTYYFSITCNLRQSHPYPISAPVLKFTQLTPLFAHFCNKRIPRQPNHNSARSLQRLLQYPLLPPSSSVVPRTELHFCLSPLSSNALLASSAAGSVGVLVLCGYIGKPELEIWRGYIRKHSMMEASDRRQGNECKCEVW